MGTIMLNGVSYSGDSSSEIEEALNGNWKTVEGIGGFRYKKAGKLVLLEQDVPDNLDDGWHTITSSDSMPEEIRTDKNHMYAVRVEPMGLAAMGPEGIQYKGRTYEGDSITVFFTYSV